MWSILIIAAVGGADVAEPVAAQARATVEARFQRIDRDRNGFITANEAPRVSSSSGPLPAVASWIENYDRDGDARISPAEYLAKALTAQVSAGVGRR